MNKKILISLSVIAAVAAIVVGGTIAYFSDTETSTGNTFTAGSIDLKVDNECYYNGKKCIKGVWEGTTIPCYCAWLEKDLTGDDLFVYFTDLKPGDHGEDTISFHVWSNDAWLCANTTIKTDDDNTCVDPELEKEPGCAVGTDGELDNYLKIFAWVDDGNNIYEPGVDKPLMGSPVPIRNYTGTYPLADKNFSIVPGGGPVKGSTTYYIGKAWCFGDMTVDPTIGTITCDGKNVANDAQTDKLMLDVSFSAIQSRNNDGYVCGD